jgi:hypothetical protein
MRLKKYFYWGIVLLMLFEIFNAFFIVPAPGSQEIDSVTIAYYLYRSRWFFRLLFGTLMLLGLVDVFRIKKWKLIFPGLLVLACAKLVHMVNYEMTADELFKQTQQLVMLPKSSNKVGGGRLIMAVEHNGEAKGYPIGFMIYHHQVLDQVGGKKLMITYCSVCRTGRVYEPLVNGKEETFRLVGMDHFNAMFEDATTNTWWRQSTGEAIVGELKGNSLPEFPSLQLSVDEFFKRYPEGKVMQPDPEFISNYDMTGEYEKGTIVSSLEGTDTASWKEKSWVVGVVSAKETKTYDWNDLKKQRIINDAIGTKPIMLVLASDNISFSAFERPGPDMCSLKADTILSGNHKYDLTGKNIFSTGPNLNKLQAYQEFWHSWRTFHPNTLTFGKTP